MSSSSAPQFGGDGYPASAPGYPAPSAAPYPPQGSGGFPSPGYPTGPGQQFGAGAAPYPPAAPNTQPGFISLPGFVDSGFTPSIQPPTNPYFDKPDEPPKYERAIPPIKQVNEEEVMAAVTEFADKKCCYGKPAPLKVQSIEMQSAFKYNLVSFTEQRETVWESEPYTNQALEGPPGTGIVPGPWDIRIYPDSSFKEQVKKFRIPNTSYTRQCHHCNGAGNVRCNLCHGMGMEICNFCRGSGRRANGENCTSCGGAGRRMCTRCHSQGWIKCRDCNGRGQLFMYLQLIATWKNYSDEFISDKTEIPDDLISKASGNRAVSEQHKMVAPFTDFPDPAITKASQELIGKHGRAYTSQMIILEQKHSVDIIRIAEVHYKWKEKSGIFHVLGDNCDVYFPDYPNKCNCCGCTIL